MACTSLCNQKKSKNSRPFTPIEPVSIWQEGVCNKKPLQTQARTTGVLIYPPVKAKEESIRGKVEGPLQRGLEEEVSSEER